MILSMTVDYKEFTVKLTEDEISDLREEAQVLDTTIYEDALILGLINQILNQD